MDDAQILDVWTAGRADPAARPLLMLAAARPDLPAGDLATLPVGRCNEVLLHDRQATFGDHLDGDVSCPHCGERLEVEVRPADLLTAPSGLDVGGVVTAGEVEVRFRPPAHADLLAAQGAADADAAVRVLLARCVLSVSRRGEPLAVDALPDDVVSTLDAALEVCDPYADLRLGTSCASCANTFELAVDPCGLYWAELAERARRLVTDVHRLASAYGWSERDILRIDPVRRDAYLELIG
jgi:DNA-directed RNA polymerase subunit RPC12/RpoP